MTIQLINLGSYANDGTGDDLRTAFQKVNANFTAIGDIQISNGVNIGGGVGVFNQKNNINLEFKSLTSSDSSIFFNQLASTIDVRAITKIESDEIPTLGGNLELNGHTITTVNGGNIESKVYNNDVNILSSVISIFINSNINFDLGSLLNPSGKTEINQTGVTIDMNGTNVTSGFRTPLQNNMLDFGFLGK